MDCLGSEMGHYYPRGPYKMAASVNVLTEAFALEQPPRLIDINRGGHFKLLALVNRFCEAVFLTALVNKK